MEKGLCNLKAHINVITKQYGLPVVVAINKFDSDTDRELELAKNEALKSGAFDACISENWALGGEGAIDLAHSVVKACHDKKNLNFKFLYDLNDTIEVIY